MPEMILLENPKNRRSGLRWSMVLAIVVMLVGLTAGHAWAQVPGAAPAAPDEKPAGLVHLILSNLDPVFWTIAVLSVTASH